jgi:hypothetical protein
VLLNASRLRCDAIIVTADGVKVQPLPAVVWCMGKGLGSDHASELVDDLANGVKVVIFYFADRACHS